MYRCSAVHGWREVESAYGTGRALPRCACTQPPGNPAAILSLCHQPSPLAHLAYVASLALPNVGARQLEHGDSSGTVGSALMSPSLGPGVRGPAASQAQESPLANREGSSPCSWHWPFNTQQRRFTVEQELAGVEAGAAASRHHGAHSQSSSTAVSLVSHRTCRFHVLQEGLSKGIGLSYYT